MFFKENSRLGTNYIYISIITIVIVAGVLVLTEGLFDTATTIAFAIILGVFNLTNLATGIFMNKQESVESAESLKVTELINRQ